VSFCASPASQSAAAAQATNGAQVCHQIQSSVQPSVISATPATPNESWCKQVPT
jgi:transcription initiation factor TFIID subunit TAF12